jgi:alpha-L-fucosidase
MEDTSRSARFAGDFATPEQQVGAFDNQFAWETCMTIGEQWAWKPNDKLKSKKECIHTLLQTIGGDGNLLFNVGPMPDGRIEQRQVEILTEMGQWLSINQEAVYGTRGGPYLPTEKMVSTHKENKIYLHLLSNPGKKLVLSLEEGISVRSARFLQDNTSLEVSRDKETLTLNLPGKLPDEMATVIELTLDRPASKIDPIKL